MCRRLPWTLYHADVRNNLTACILHGTLIPPADCEVKDTRFGMKCDCSGKCTTGNFVHNKEADSRLPPEVVKDTECLAPLDAACDAHHGFPQVTNRGKDNPVSCVSNTYYPTGTVLTPDSCREKLPPTLPAANSSLFTAQLPAACNHLGRGPTSRATESLARFRAERRPSTTVARHLRSERRGPRLRLIVRGHTKPELPRAPERLLLHALQLAAPVTVTPYTSSYDWCTRAV